MAHDTRSQDMKKLEGAIATANLEQAQWNDKMARLLEQQGQQQLSSDTRLLRLEELISGISLQQNTLLQKLHFPTGETSSSQEHSRNSQEGMFGKNDWQYGGHYKFHKPRRDFPSFEGEDVHKWLYKCNQYFEIEEVPDADKLKLASYYLDDTALYWHQNFMRSNGDRVVTWSEYVEAICGRFGGHKDPLEELKDLKQDGELEAYIKDFDVLWNRAEIDERYALIFFLVEDEEDNEDNAVESVREMEELEGTEPHISMNALEGVPGCYTLKVTGRLHKLPIFILVDSGSTHNFMNMEVANKLQCKQTSINPVTIKAANGGKMLCSSICKNFRWKMQGNYFVTDVFVMELDACDMVLGVQWLATLGDIMCNYKSMWMNFLWQGRRVTLKGNEPVKLQSVPYGQMSGLLDSNSGIAGVSLCSLSMVQATEETKALLIGTNLNQEERGALQNLLNLYQDRLNQFHPLRAINRSSSATALVSSPSTKKRVAQKKRVEATLINPATSDATSTSWGHVIRHVITLKPHHANQPSRQQTSPHHPLSPCQQTYHLRSIRD
uniref:Retrotransposon gag domain-containing protein n=1 Tax=Populus alba TaxID=43335 RepID=A0A4U5MHW9_POPAL|nr:hypothetical protein D5086_0000309060 [Populus alba]